MISCMTRKIIFAGLILTVTSGVLAYTGSSSGIGIETAALASPSVTVVWWFWPLMLFVVTFIIGVVAVLGGVGGGVLFVPIVSGFFPFHLDFVRCAGLLVALASSLSAGPILLKKGLANLRLAMPLALVASWGAILGATLGLIMPRHIVQISLGVAILVIAGIMLRAQRSDYPEVRNADSLSAALGIGGVYHEASAGKDISWQAHRTPQALVIFVLVGVVAGMFGLGAGWATVPVLNLMMGVPLKMAVSTSNFLLSITGSSAAWVYINKGAVLPIIVAPSVVGMMIGARVGAFLLPRVKPGIIKYIIITLLVFSGLRVLLKGCGF